MTAANRRTPLLLAVFAALFVLWTTSSASAAVHYGAREVNKPGTPTASAFPGELAFWAGSCDLISATTAVGTAPANPHDCIDTGAYPVFGVKRDWSTPPSWRLTSIAQAGAHPDASATFAFEPQLDEDGTPVEATKDLSVEIPRGVLGNPGAIAKCSLADFGASPVQCPPQSQVGITDIRLIAGVPIAAAGNSGYPVYNLKPRRGYVAEFGIPDAAGFFGVGTSIRIFARARTESDFGITTGVFQIPTAYPLTAQTLTIWGVPWAASHDRLRIANGSPMRNPCQPGSQFIEGLAANESGLPVACRAPYDPSWGPIQPFFSLQTDCATSDATTRAALDSYFHPARWVNPEERLAFRVPDFTDPNWLRYEAPAPPVAGCEGVEWDPSLALDPVSQQADSPTAFDVALTTPQNNEAPEAVSHNPDDATGAPAFFKSTAGLATSHLKDTVVKLAKGLTFNASAANGSPGNSLDGCSPSEIGLTSPLGVKPITFNNSDVSCPDASKIGTVEVHTPVLDEELPGVIYLADQDQNPFKSTFAIYLVLQNTNRNLIVKIAGSVEPDPVTGQITSRFLDNPQLPFSTFTLHFKGGPRATLASPTTCGSPPNEADLTGWSDPTNPVHVDDPFEITTAPGGGACATDPAGRPFNLGLSAGSQSAGAGAHAPFSLEVTRADGNQEINTLDISPPEGLAASLKGVPYCSEAQLKATEARTGKAEQANSACPAASQVGTDMTGSGAGPTPLYTPGKLYLAGPYKGAPLSVAAVTPAVAGPFDFGNVVVRTALFIDRASARVTAKTDPIPQVFAGIPLRIRDIRIDLDRKDFTLNPTNCDAMAVDVTATGASGASTKGSSPFQVGGCKDLNFKPKLTAKLKGGTKRGAHPAFTAELNYPPGPGYANIKDVQVTLPHSEFLDQAHINTICTRVQAAAHQCPQGSIYGFAEATTPLLDGKLTGPVFLKSSDHQLPDLAIALKGPDNQPVEVEFAGRIDSVHAQIRNTIEGLPDVPVTKFVLRMKGGRKGLLVNSRNLCASKATKMTVNMTGQNNKRAASRPKLVRSCKGKKVKKKAKPAKHRTR